MKDATNARNFVDSRCEGMKVTNKRNSRLNFEQIKYINRMLRKKTGNDDRPYKEVLGDLQCSKSIRLFHMYTYSVLPLCYIKKILSCNVLGCLISKVMLFYS